jgi:pyruvate dehydrogenase E2 component (dihydrolipoamide acetyltransferase)
MVEAVSASWQTIPHFTLIREVDAARLLAWRQSAQDRVPTRLSITDLLVQLVAAALRRHPRVNGVSVEDNRGNPPEVHLGLAVAVEDGLVVPVIHRADTLSLGQIAAVRTDLVDRAHKGRLRLEELQGGSFTISNLGMHGVDAFTAIVPPAQTGILAVGRISDRVVARDGRPVIQPVMILSATFDHRVVDGARGAQFLETLAWGIEAAG